MSKLLKSHPEATSADFYIGADNNSPFQRQDKLAALCMGAVASWSQAETFLLRAVVAILGGKNAPDAVEYLRSGKLSEKEEIIKNKGLPRLSPRDRDLFQKIRAKLKQHGHERNDLAHGFWGDTGRLPDALLWIDAKDVSMEFHPRGLGDFNNNIWAWADKVRVYKAADFTRMTKNNVLDASLLASFHTTLVGYGGDWHRARLLADLAGG